MSRDETEMTTQLPPSDAGSNNVPRLVQCQLADNNNNRREAWGEVDESMKDLDSRSDSAMEELPQNPALTDGLLLRNTGSLASQTEDDDPILTLVLEFVEKGHDTLG